MIRILKRTQTTISSVLLSLTLLSASMGIAQGQSTNDQILQLFPSGGQGCLDTVKVNLTEAIRSGIEAEVLRAEDALKAPHSISALGCLDNLFDVNLDIAIQVPNLQGIFQQAVSMAQDQICGFAQEKMNELTAEVNALLQLPNFNFLPIGGLTGNSTTSIGGVDLNVGGGQVGQGITVNGSTVSRTNLDEVYELIYGGNNGQ